MILKCPSCQQALIPTQNTYRCSNNHCFDIAKEGYTNLLLAQHKRSKNPGDDNTMMACRQAFLNQGYYQFLVDALVAILDNANDQTLLDIGCGEGFYGHQIKQHYPRAQLAGIDIAKGGVRLAAKRKSNNAPAYTQLAVASAYDLPFMTQNFDCAVSVFSPVDPPETARVLKPGGQLIIVGPAKNHLKGLAESIYDEFKPHANGFRTLEGHPSFERLGSTIIEQNATIEGASIYQLLTMTPYFWSTSEEKQAAIKKRATLSTPLAFEISRYKRL
ncbi:putative RNA methyltransferase [Marinagarivorans algicola]|uniref:putative RNA methyltransferase n=1 Tax=Marinagarivorans algicola TaxID=1513270 RepID=UPI0006B556B2|nr:methyltransferase domain-containing protein [Marinagarivorans algicola]